MPFPAPSYTSGDWTVRFPVSAPILSAPIPGVNVDYVLKQKFSILANHFEKAELNTPYSEYYPDGADFAEYDAFILCVESEPVDMGGGCLEWEATFARVPATHEEPSEIDYDFIGFYGAFGVNAITIDGRPREVRYVPARIQYDYFLLEPGQSLDEIPIEQAQEYYVNTPSLKTNFLADAPPFTVASTPSRTEYQAMIDAEQEIVAVPSRRHRWMGNIIQRETIYIKAQ